MLLDKDDDSLMTEKITRFVLLFEGRTGSTFIKHSLDSHPNISMKGEFLAGEDSKAQEKIIRNLYSKVPNGIQAIGFKTRLRQIIDRKKFLELMDEFEVKVIVMYRRNLIKLALSEVNSLRLFKKYGKWNLFEGKKPLPLFAPTIEEFDKTFQSRKAYEEKLQAFMTEIKRDMIVRDYQDLLDDREKLFNEFFEFFGVEPFPLKSPIRKNTSENMREILLNYDEIKNYYSDTPYAKMFD